MAHYAQDPRWIVAKFAGKDKNGAPFNAGARVFYYPNGKVVLTGAAAEKAAAEFEGARQDEESGLC